MKTFVLFGVFAAAGAYASPLADRKWLSRILGAAVFCIVTTAGVLAMTTDE
ncbi:hypothetical protein [Bradyrhizobium paxllaeri]|uniref:hypothetical protein n=1 Tax=Bradyrhizobium paxllaeri TaxID=190148 RepID=UPI00165275AC|nr:hypothetical protein [Bradyrhizobium paxllaeri]